MEKLNKIRPLRRFPGFIDDGGWKEQKFGSLFIFLSNNTLSRADLKEGKGDVYNVHYGDVLIKLNAYTDIHQGKLPSIKTVNDIDKYLKARLQDGDIVIADTAEDETVGKCTEIVNVHDTIVVSGLHTIPCRPQIKFAQAYLGYYMNSNAFHSKLLPIMQGVKVTSISKSALQNIDLAFPKSLEEQQKIAECLSSIDSYISSINEKVEQLKAHKTSLLQKLFPQNGKKVPEYRFPEFKTDEDWTTNRVGESFKLQGGFAFKSNKFVTTGIPVIRISNIPSDSSVVNLQNCVFYEELPNMHNYTANDGDLLIAMSGATTGKTAIYRGKRPVYVNQRVGIFRLIDSSISYPFICQWIRTELFSNQIKKMLAAGAQPNISSNDIESLLWQHPQNMKEQIQIASCLSSIDDLIDAYKNKLIYIGDYKKGLMQQLFPNK